MRTPPPMTRQDTGKKFSFPVAATEDGGDPLFTVELDRDVEMLTAASVLAYDLAGSP